MKGIVINGAEQTLAPIAGTAVVIGRTAEGALTHTRFDPDTLKPRIKFL